MAIEGRIAVHHGTVKDEPTPLLRETTFVEYSTVRVQECQDDGRGKMIDVVDRSIRVGSGTDCDLRLEDPSVSRHHCAISPAAGGVRVRDEGSTNGVWLAGSRVYDALIVGSRELSLGNCRLRIEPVSAKQRREVFTANRFGDLLGATPQMRQLFARMAQWARVDAPILILGETGSGKELAADAIHRASRRASGPFIVLDCSSIPAGLQASQLFGHVRGAFTGAVGDYRGAFEQAHGGTLFLDEIGELPVEQQGSLLRVLQEGTIHKLGVEKPGKVDVRVLAATHQDLDHSVQTGRFRRDLYFRLEASTIRLPPLRDRLEDLPLLVEAFAERFGVDIESIPEEIWEMFQRHSWPGNVRELRNAVLRFAVEGDPCLPKQEPNPESEPLPPLNAARASAEALSREARTLGAARMEVVERFERAYLSTLLRQTRGSVPRAAAVAGVTEWGLRKLMKKHGVQAASFRH